MAHVTLWGFLKPLAGGEGELELDARNIRDLPAAVARKRRKPANVRISYLRAVSVPEAPSTP